MGLSNSPDDNAARNYLNSLINGKNFVPVISNSFRLRQIFKGAINVSEASGGAKMTIDQIFAKYWAAEVGYPYPDAHELVKVAQYWQTHNKYVTPSAKYLLSLKKFFLEQVDHDLSGGVVEDSENIRKELAVFKKEITDEQKSSKKFSEFVVDQYSYPKFNNGVKDPLRLLARLDISIYITTGYFDFLERAIRSECDGQKRPEKKPVTQFWSPNLSDSDRTLSSAYRPSNHEPVVYHLFGLEDKDESSLVLSEDDHLEFLIKNFESTDLQNPIIPNWLRQELALSPLLLLGFQIHDLDFRVLFRFLSKFRKDPKRQCVIIQLEPDQITKVEQKESIDYLTRYFERSSFDLIWEDAESVIQKLNNN